jgi:hypothetical protein
LGLSSVFLQFSATGKKLPVIISQKTPNCLCIPNFPYPCAAPDIPQKLVQQPGIPKFMQSDLYTILNCALQDKNLTLVDLPKGKHHYKDSRTPGLVVFIVGTQLKHL